jgi:wyosine [tRNA(Phe)-imidazoG37] synthetase (radical SAM superfamily)
MQLNWQEILPNHYASRVGLNGLEVWMTALPLQTGIIYGPVKSRRLGNSLGINLLPPSRKVCTFDCVYCHYGPAQIKDLSSSKHRFPDVENVLAAVDEALLTFTEIDYLTFSGNGEPTLHPCFPDIVSAVRRLRDTHRPELRLAMLSNSTTVNIPAICESISLIDHPIMKLDAGDSKTFKQINRPFSEDLLDDIIQGLSRLPNLSIQTMFIAGEVTNSTGAALEAWLARLQEIQPSRIQIYSVDRPASEAGVERVPTEMLKRIADEVERGVGLQIQAY